MFQRRHSEAIDLFERSLTSFKAVNDEAWQVRNLLHHAAALTYSDRHEEVLAPLEEAKRILKSFPDEDLSFLVNHTAAYNLARTGKWGQAKELLTVVSEHYQITRPLWRYQCQWVEGIVEHGLGHLEAADEWYLQASRGLEAIGETLYVNLIMLDLAMLYAETRQIAKVVEVAVAVCRFFDALKLCDETVMSLELLKTAIAQVDIDQAVLSQFRSNLWRDPIVTLQQKRGVRDFHP